VQQLDEHALAAERRRLELEGRVALAESTGRDRPPVCEFVTALVQAWIQQRALGDRPAAGAPAVQPYALDHGGRERLAVEVDDLDLETHSIARQELGDRGLARPRQPLGVERPELDDLHTHRDRLDHRDRAGRAKLVVEQPAAA
jgi:hypothetical protein